jgi:hypothetical protein
VKLHLVSNAWKRYTSALAASSGTFRPKDNVAIDAGLFEERQNMLICSNCGKRIRDGLTECRLCGAPGVEFNEDDRPEGLLQKPWLQALLVAVVLVLAIGLVRQVSARRQNAVTTIVEEPKETPVPKAPASSGPETTLLVTPSPSPSGDPIPDGSIPMLPSIVTPNDLPLPSPTVSPDTVDPNGDAAPETNSMPANVRAWLEHLQEIEGERQTLAASQMAAAAGLAGQAANAEDGGASDYSNAALVVRSAWADLQQRFLEEPAPAECASIRSLYTSAITGTRATMLDMISALRTARQSPERALVSLTRIRDESDQRVDAPAEATDEAIDALCARYNADKWFDIDNQLGAHLVSQLGL